MKIDTQTLQVEITISPAERRKGGQRSSANGSKVPDPPRIPRITRLMALAIKFQYMVERGEVRDYADLARLGYVTRARITQIMNLLNLAPDIQEQLLLPALPTSEVGERHLRCVTSAVCWQHQRRVWAQMKIGTTAVQATTRH
jgi:hypothetical protein